MASRPAERITKFSFEVKLQREIDHFQSLAGRWKYTLEYPERESLRTHLDAAQGMVLQLLH